MKFIKQWNCVFKPYVGISKFLREILHTRNVSVRARQFGCHYLRCAHNRYFSFVAFSTGTPEVHLFFNTEATSGESCFVWLEVAGLFAEPNLKKYLPTMLAHFQIFVIFVGLTSFPCFLFRSSFNDLPFDFVSAYHNPTG